MPRHRDRRGGSRTPDSPAAVSGPGALSARTDGGPASPPPMSDAPVARHGEGPVTEALERATAGPAPAGPIQDPFAPNDPGDVQGDPFAEGPAPPPEDPAEAYRASEEFLDAMLIGPALPVLEHIAARPGTSQATRNIVRRMRSQLPTEFDFSEVFADVQMAIAEDEEELDDIAVPRGEG